MTDTEFINTVRYMVVHASLLQAIVFIMASYVTFRVSKATFGFCVSVLVIVILTPLIMIAGIASLKTETPSEKNHQT